MDSFETLAFYRGVSNDFETNFPTVNAVPDDRKPRNLVQEIHVAADDWFYGRFGKRYRSQSLFVTASKFTASRYAASDRHLLRVVPLSPYSFCWSPNVSDLLSLLLDAQVADVDRRLSGAAYREAGLLEAHQSGHEVMLSCETYIAIPVWLMDGNPDQSESGSLIIV